MLRRAVEAVCVEKDFDHKPVTSHRPSIGRFGDEPTCTLMRLVYDHRTVRSGRERDRMRVSLVRLAAGSAIAFALVIGAACTANVGGGGPPVVAASSAAPAQTYGQTPSAGAGMTTSQCDAEYAANNAAIKASGQTKRVFIAACRARNATIPQSTAGAPPPLPPPPPPPPWWPTSSLLRPKLRLSPRNTRHRLQRARVSSNPLSRPKRDVRRTRSCGSRRAHISITSPDPQLRRNEHGAYRG